MKRDIGETGENFFSISPTKVFVNSDTSKGSQDEGSNQANKPGLTGKQTLLARLLSEPIESPARQSFNAIGYRLAKSGSKNSLLANRKTYIKAHYRRCKLQEYELLAMCTVKSYNQFYKILPLCFGSA